MGRAKENVANERTSRVSALAFSDPPHLVRQTGMSSIRVQPRRSKNQTDHNDYLEMCALLHGTSSVSSWARVRRGIMTRCFTPLTRIFWL